jgi:hypothetical protein
MPARPCTGLHEGVCVCVCVYIDDEFLLLRKVRYVHMCIHVRLIDFALAYRT